MSFTVDRSCQGLPIFISIFLTREKRELIATSAVTEKCQSFPSHRFCCDRVVYDAICKLQYEVRALRATRIEERLDLIRDGWRETFCHRTFLSALVYGIMAVYITVCTYFLFVHGNVICRFVKERSVSVKFACLLCLRCCFAAVVFDSSTSNAWIVSSVVAFSLDVFVYHSIGVIVRSCAHFAALLSAGTDGTKMAQGTGRLMEQLCINFNS
jgi:hypothetical protein